MLQLALTDIRKQGVNPFVVETFRPQERQNYLYCQGRTITEASAVGINNTFAKAYCNPKAGKVTWTLHSVHTSRKAIDLIPQRLINGKMTAIWNAQDPHTRIIINTMQKYGFEAGANWISSQDSPHFQVKGNYDEVFDCEHTNTYVTQAIQKALNKVLNKAHSKTNNNTFNKPISKIITVDGIWGPLTTKAITDFYQPLGLKLSHGQIDAEMLNALFLNL